VIKPPESGLARSAPLAHPGSVPDIIARLASELGASDVVVYLVDFAQRTLEPLPDRRSHAELPASEEVTTTMAGRCFTTNAAVCVERPEGFRVWVPVVEASDRTGVLGLTLPAAPDDVISACIDLGVLAGYLIATHARLTDVYNLHRRRRSLTLAASMQWDLLPPMVLKTAQLQVAGLVEPAYDVGGDCFDYALNGATLDFAIFDPVGHHLRSALLAALTVGSYRHDRREGQTLEQIHLHLDEVVRAQFPGAFVTGQLARLSVETGELRWMNSGHPLPLLVRAGRVVGELDCPPMLPWGLGAVSGVKREAAVATAALEPGDSVLFHTDGITEAHLPGGEQFGVEKLVDLLGQNASDGQEPEETVRRLVQAVLDHQEGNLGDDATLVLVQWSGPA
jgi:serine phosphatase RsbU (regulator of sigma subunit)